MRRLTRHDADGNVLTATDVLGTLTYTYNRFGQVLTATDRMGGGTTNTYDAKGNLLTTKDALNNTTTLTYTTKGQLATVTDAKNNRSTLAYDANGRLTRLTDADNKLTSYAYDARSRLTSITNALSQKVDYTYDANDRLKRITYPDTNYREFTYDLAGRRTRIRDEKGNNTNFTYDAAYRLTKVTDAVHNTATYTYDLMSNMTSLTNGVGKTTNYEYDNFDRLTKVVYPAASTGATRLEERYEYDAVGNVVKHIDTANRQTLYGYDSSHRLTSETDALNQVTRYEYNARSLRTKVTDAKGQQYLFTYDALGRRLSQTRDGQTMSWQYDALGNVSKRTDYAARATDYTYDKLNRLTQISYVGQTAANVSYTYDALGRMVSAVNNAGTVTFTYDNRGRLTSENDVHGQAVGYGYEANGNRSSLTIGGTNHTTYAYDAADRLTGLTSASDNLRTTYSYDKADRLTSKVLPNGITTTYEYDGLSRLTRLKDATTVKTHYNRQYSYNTASQIARITEPAKTRNFAYDRVDRLTGMTSPTAGVTAESYAYDAVGNRTSSHKSASYTVGTFNKLTGTASATYTYDANGSMTSKVAGGVTWTYVWDYENRMTSAATGTTTVNYEYDGLGRRVKRTTEAGTPVVKPTVPAASGRLTVSATSVTKVASVTVSWALTASSSGAQLSNNGRLRLYKVGDDDSAPAWQEYETTAASGSRSVFMPNIVGDYEFRYFLSDGMTKLGTSGKISVNAASFGLRLPSKLNASRSYWIDQRSWFVLGESMQIAWEAPAGQTSATDWVGLYKVGEADTAAPQWRQNTGGGTAGSLSVKLPSAAGEYELRYFSGAGNTKRVTSDKLRIVDAASYKLTASAATVKAAATMRISWQVSSPAGVAGEYDVIELYKVGDSDAAVAQWKERTRRRITGSVAVRMPSVAGDYEFRYFLDRGDGKKVATSSTVKVEATRFGVTAAETFAVTGESIDASWQVPPLQVSATDWVGLYKVGELDTAAPQSRHDNTSGTDVGSVSLTMPSAAGEYELRYFSGAGNVKKAVSRKIKVVDAAGYKVEVSATTVAAGDRVGMLWEAPPGQATDWVGLYKVGDSDVAYQWKRETKGGATGSFAVKMPSVAGSYEFRYFLGSGNRKVKTSAVITGTASTGSGAGAGASGGAGGSGSVRREVIKYTYDGWDVIREESSLNGITVYQNGLGIDEKLRSKNGNVVRYFLTDHLGSTVALTDSSGAIVSSTSYDSFGNAASSIPTSYQYTGREYDSDTGLYYYRNRWYDPEIGRFISEDPIGFAGGDINLYGYVWNNPYSFRDPYGEHPLVALAFLLGVAAHIALNPSYVNAPAPCKPVIRESDEVSVGGILGAAAGMAGGPALGKVAGAVLRGAAGAIGRGLSAVGRAVGRGIEKATKSVTRSNPSATKGAPDITKAYKRPSGATTKAQRKSVQGKPCVDCGITTSKQVADHKYPLVKEYYRTGSIDKTRMRDVNSVQPQCPTCSARQGARMSRFSRQMKKEHGLE